MGLNSKMRDKVAAYFGYVPVEEFAALDDVAQEAFRRLKEASILEEFAHHAGIVNVQIVRDDIGKRLISLEVSVDFDIATPFWDRCGVVFSEKVIEEDITDKVNSVGSEDNHGPFGDPDPQSIDAGSGGDWAGVPTPVAEEFKPDSERYRDPVSPGGVLDPELFEGNSAVEIVEECGPISE